jgi:hypothetical protein
MGKYIVYDGVASALMQYILALTMLEDYIAL